MTTARWEPTRSSSTDQFRPIIRSSARRAPLGSLSGTGLDSVVEADLRSCSAKATTTCENSQAVALSGTRNTFVRGRVSPSAPPPFLRGVQCQEMAFVSEDCQVGQDYQQQNRLLRNLTSQKSGQ
jgi:hypothetical protein